MVRTEKKDEEVMEENSFKIRLPAPRIDPLRIVFRDTNPNNKKIMKKLMLKIKIVRPFFYKRCDRCRNDFKREKMWLVKNHIFGVWAHYYLCAKCCETEIEVTVKK